MTDNILLMRSIKRDTFVNLVFNQTTSCAIRWNRITSNMFQSELPTDDLWIIRSERIVSRSGERFFLQMYKNGSVFVDVQDKGAEEVFDLIDRVTVGQPCVSQFTNALNGQKCCNVPRETYFQTATGGVVANGSGIGFKAAHFFFLQGGVKISGVSEVLSFSVFDIGGGVVVGGTNTEEITALELTDGGVVVGGISTEGRSWLELADGGVVAGGDAFVDPYLPLGGVVVSGIGDVYLVIDGNSIFDEIASGGVVCNGRIFNKPVIEV